MAFIHERAMARPDPSVLIHVPIMGGATAAVGAEERPSAIAVHPSC